ncbi:MAG TPA: serine/threonine-protein kinase [Terracidiphilus sp.]
MTVTKTIGRYEIVEELGRGAMGSVFKARDPAVGRTVALKTILSVALTGAQSQEYVSRFLREAHAAGSLAHPGIVPVFDVGEHEGVPFLVMEFVEGRTLAEAMHKGERFTLDQVCEIGGQIGEALGYAHRHGVVHRDIKPANILMTSRAVYGFERPRITDFGIAKLTDTAITTTGQLMGTPSFMPPEQFTGSPIDGRADLFSLGVILYSLATGEQPFPGETMTAVSYKVVHTVPIPPSKLNPAMPPMLEGVILKCLAKNPAERYQTGDELAQDLASVRANAGSTVLRSTPPPMAAVLDSEVTLAPTVRSFPPSQVHASGTNGGPAARPGAAAEGTPTAAGPAAKKSDPGKKQGARQGGTPGIKRLGVIAVGVVAMVAIGLMVETWLGVRHRLAALHVPTPAPAVAAASAPTTSAQAAPEQQGSATTSASTPAAASAATPEPSANHKASHEKPSPAVHVKDSKPSPAIPVAPAPSTAAPAPVASATPPPAPHLAAPAAPAFDPKVLDPKTNAKLKVDLKHVPDGLAFTIQMNSKPYLHAIAGQKGVFDDLFVPPGIQEFSVVYQCAGQQKSTNIVSDEFKAKKRRTLRVELAGQTKTPAVVQGALNGDGQLFLSLK